MAHSLNKYAFSSLTPTESAAFRPSSFSSDSSCSSVSLCQCSSTCRSVLDDQNVLCCYFILCLPFSSLSRQDLRAHVAPGLELLNSDTLTWTDGQSEWLPLSQMPGDLCQRLPPSAPKRKLHAGSSAVQLDDLLAYAARCGNAHAATLAMVVRTQEGEVPLPAGCAVFQALVPESPDECITVLTSLQVCARVHEDLCVYLYVCVPVF